MTESDPIRKVPLGRVVNVKPKLQCWTLEMLGPWNVSLKESCRHGEGANTTVATSIGAGETLLPTAAGTESMLLRARDGRHEAGRFGVCSIGFLPCYAPDPSCRMEIFTLLLYIGNRELL